MRGKKKEKKAHFHFKEERMKHERETNDQNAVKGVSEKKKGRGEDYLLGPEKKEEEWRKKKTHSLR